MFFFVFLIHYLISKLLKFKLSQTLVYLLVKNLHIIGDIRVNENSALISQHTFWMRQHNSILKKLIEMNPKWDDTRLFQVQQHCLLVIKNYQFKLTFCIHYQTLFFNSICFLLKLELNSCQYFRPQDSLYQLCFNVSRMNIFFQ